MRVPLGPDGTLPAGVHGMAWDDLVAQFGWNPHRQRLLAGLRRAMDDLRAAGCETVNVDGSFVTAKESPEDFDACWDRSGVDLRRLLHTPLRTFDRGRATQKATYGGELLPADAQADDAGRRFLDFFQVDRETGRPKGIVAVDLRSLP